MYSESAVSEKNFTPGNLALATGQAGGEKTDVARQGQGGGVSVVQGRDSNSSSLLTAASPPTDRAANMDSMSIATSVTASQPTITTTTNSTSTTVTSTTVTSTTVTSTAATAPQQRVTLLSRDGDCLSRVWDHYTECATLIHGISLIDACGTELVRQIGRIPCTTTFYPVDDAFIDGFIRMVHETFASATGIADLEKEQQCWVDYQKRASSQQQEKLSVWIKIFHYALMVAKALHKEEAQAGQHDPAGKLVKLRNPIDGMRKNLARIHLGDMSSQDTSWLGEPGNASSASNATPASNKRQRAGSTTALRSLPSLGGKKTPAQLPEENIEGFGSKEEALLAWKKKADRQFDKQDVSRSLLQFLERSLGAISTDGPVLYCIAYKFVASIVFAESTRGIGIGEALVEATENELGYVNEILILREKLRAVVRPDSSAAPQDKRHCQMWLDFFGKVGELMAFRRDNRKKAIADSPDMTQTLASCEIAYDALVKAMRQADQLMRQQDENARARQKAERAKERRRKGLSMDFLMPGKTKRAAETSGARDADAIGLSPRKKIAKQAQPGDKVAGEKAAVKMTADMDGAAMQEGARVRKKSPPAEGLPDGALPVTNQPTSPIGSSKPKKKSAAFEVAQQEAGPARATEKKKATSRATRADRGGNVDAPKVEENDKPRKGGKEEREAKEVKTEKTEKTEKTPGKASKGTKED